MNKDELTIIPRILEFFNLGDLLRTEPAKSGISNHNYLAETTIGEYFIKFVINQSVESLQNDLYIQKQLKKSGVNSPTYMFNDKNQHLYSDEQFRVVVSKRIVGESPRKINENLAHDFGEILGKFHLSVKKLPNPNEKGLMNPKVSKISSSIFDTDLPVGTIHGDFYSGNALVDIKTKSKIVAMLDFEEAGENVLIIDLALTVMGVCSKNADSVDLDLIKNTISGYENARKMSKHEKDHFDEAINYAASTWIKWFSENDYKKYAIRHKNKVKSYNSIKDELLTWLKNH
ncbi:phosphotransferase [Candidatus Dojkabacteria bacterium]|nr:phosphotransferase [Candidatus Dojkabacteria bacterium]